MISAENLRVGNKTGEVGNKTGEVGNKQDEVGSISTRVGSKQKFAKEEPALFLFWWLICRVGHKHKSLKRLAVISKHELGLSAIDEYLLFSVNFN